MQAGPFITSTVLVGTSIIIVHTQAALPWRHGPDKDNGAVGGAGGTTWGAGTNSSGAGVSSARLCTDVSLQVLTSTAAPSDKEMA
jgi:hypothetical protein